MKSGRGIPDPAAVCTSRIDKPVDEDAPRGRGDTAPSDLLSRRKATRLTSAIGIASLTPNRGLFPRLRAYPILSGLGHLSRISLSQHDLDDVCQTLCGAVQDLPADLG